MVIGNFNIEGVIAFPSKADTPLVVDTDAPLTNPVTSKFFQPVGRRNPQIIQRDRVVYHA